jgi:hypothetical protein
MITVYNNFHYAVMLSVVTLIAIMQMIIFLNVGASIQTVTSMSTRYAYIGPKASVPI